MSASILLKNGLIDPALVPASVVPENPVFQSVGINNTGADATVLVLSHPDADSQFILQKDDAGVIDFIQLPLSGTGTTFLSVNGLANEMTIGGVDNLQLNGETLINVVSPVINLGDPADASPQVQIVGTGATGTVYDTVFNPVSRNFANIFPAGFINLNASAPVSQNFVPARTGLHSLNICVQYNGLTTIGNDNIEYAFSSLSAGNTTCGVIKPADLPAYNASRNGIYNFALMGYLTGGVSYTFTITAYGTGWNLDVQPSYAPIC
jgi:hypothetical protein